MIYSKKFIVLDKNKQTGKGLFADYKIKKGEILIRFGNEISETPAKTSIQINEREYLEGIESTNAFLNHSCEPNSYIDFERFYLRALRNIEKGEEITYNYCTTEYDLYEKFICLCGSPKCYGRIKGFKYLSKAQKLKLNKFLAPYLKGKNI
ncbi:MAG: SET domain-containing protein [Armatimonadetes bacterium]|nr:SET domain-containing protein [Armatimonadota bacterium]